MATPQSGTTYNVLFSKTSDTGSKSTLTVKNADPDVTSQKVQAFVNAYHKFYNSEQTLSAAYLEKREVSLVWGNI